jgi:hypothetical protein
MSAGSAVNGVDLDLGAKRVECVEKLGECLHVVGAIAVRAVVLAIPRATTPTAEPVTEKMSAIISLGRLNRQLVTAVN